MLPTTHPFLLFFRKAIQANYRIRSVSIDPSAKGVLSSLIEYTRTFINLNDFSVEGWVRSFANFCPQENVVISSVPYPNGTNLIMVLLRR